ncbi:uncharacterized protein B0P05DRAFT_476707, partial [Gilbertella persicaria]|uniref:uncharacterized protein n=1 Tax=Gilbertella persicaria TaxID=101096 RepID=UPI00221E4A39
TCIFCFKHLERPYFVEVKNGKIIKKSTKDSLMCVNPECVSVKHDRSTKCLDILSSFAIGLSELTLCLLGVPIPHFSQNQISQYGTEELKTQTSIFVQEEENSQLRCN